MDKVYGGTDKVATSLCDSCRNATIARGHALSIIECSIISTRSNLASIQPVVTCTDYDNKANPSLSSMREIAWKLEPSKKTGKLGFAPPKDKYVGIVDPFSGKDTY